MTQIKLSEMSKDMLIRELCLRVIRDYTGLVSLIAKELLSRI